MMDYQDSHFNQDSFFKSSTLLSNTRSKENADMSLMISQSYLFSEHDVNLSTHELLTVGEKESCVEQEVLNAFMKILTSCRDAFVILEDYKGICNEMVDVLKGLSALFFPVPRKKVKVDQMLSLMTMELNTWMLVQALYRERLYLTSLQMDDVETSVDVKDSEKEMVANIFNENCTLREAQVVIDWLEFQSRFQMDGKSYNIELFSEQGSCRENSLHMLLHKDSRFNSCNNLISELDPDGPTRQNKRLSSMDDDDEDKLMSYIFSCIKSGQLDEACKACIKVGQPWRAATLQGWKLFHDPNVKCLGPGGVMQKIDGNHLRNLWRTACWQMAENDKVSSIERAIYASLSCHLKSLLPACKSWHEYLWAYMRVYVDQKVDNFIRTSPLSVETSKLSPSGYDTKLHFEEIFFEIESSLDEEIKKQSQYRFNIIQKYIILDQIEILVDCMSKWCKEDTLKPHPTLLRFMTHLLFFFKSSGASFSDQQEADIICSYVDWLVEIRQVELIATYTSYLPVDLQVVKYAKFLEGISGTDNQRHCMELAENAGLDTKSIALTVVQNICKDSPFLDKNIFQSLLSQDVNEDDLKKINAIEWLLLDDGWRLEAIQQSNALFRMFISFKKIKSCNMLMKLIPRNSIEMIIRFHSSQSKHLPARVTNAVREFMCVSAYLEAQESFSQWFDHLHNGTPTEPIASGLSNNLADKVMQEHLRSSYETNLGNWKNSLSGLASNSITRIKEVLEFADGGWMVDQEDEEGQHSRRQEMTLIRQLCIPFLFTLLQSVYFCMEMFEGCGQLYDLLMSENHKLYKVFSKDELDRFSTELVSSSISSLNKQLGPLGYTLYNY